MTVRGDLEKAIAMAHASKGSYMMFAAESEDQKAQKVFNEMAEDMDRHVKILESRREYLDKHNQLNAKLSGQDKNKDKDQDQGGDDQKEKQN